jgi:hypothetical protein
MFVFDRILPSGTVAYQQKICDSCYKRRSSLMYRDKEFAKYIKESFIFVGYKVNDNSTCDKCEMDAKYPCN